MVPTVTPFSKKRKGFDDERAGASKKTKSILEDQEELALRLLEG